MSANIETMAYANAVPWHGLGVNISETATVEEMLQAAGLDWTASKRLIRIRTSRNGDDEHIVPGYVAIARDTDNTVYQVATERYKIVQNKAVMEFFRHWAESGDATLETAGALGNGAKVWALAKMKNSHFQLSGGDAVNTYVLLANSHDGTMGLTGMPTTVRVVCQNTLAIALDTSARRAIGKFVMRHSTQFNADKRESARKQMEVAMSAGRQFAEVAHELSEAKADPSEIKSYVLQLSQPDVYAELDARTDREKALGEIFGGANELEVSRRSRAILESIFNSPGSDMASAKGTWWGALNGVTHYVDHEQGRGRDTALTSAWFGAGAQLKGQAKELALVYARR